MQTIALLNSKDAVHFGLPVSLKVVMDDLRSLVEDGIYDEQTNKTLQVRVICNLGDNLGEYIFILRYQISKFVRKYNYVKA